MKTLIAIFGLATLLASVGCVVEDDHYHRGGYYGGYYGEYPHRYYGHQYYHYQNYPAYYHRYHWDR